MIQLPLEGRFFTRLCQPSVVWLSPCVMFWSRLPSLLNIFLPSRCTQLHVVPLSGALSLLSMFIALGPLLRH